MRGRRPGGAARRRPCSGRPRASRSSPSGWLITVATRRLIDRARSESARRRREEDRRVARPRRAPPQRGARPVAGAPDVGRRSDHDDTLTLLFLCCHPDLSPPSQLALTLRAVGGLTTAEIASAFLVPEATMAQRISRAKQRVKDKTFTRRRSSACDVVLHVLYLIFNEGYTASSGPELARVELTREAIRLTRLVHRLLPADREVAGLLALMLLTDARRAARIGPSRPRPAGRAGPLALGRGRDRRGRRADRGDAPAGPVGPYQLQAAIAAVHAEAAERRRHRLAPDPRALRPPRPPRPEPDGHAQPRRRRRHGLRPPGRPRRPRGPGLRSSRATTASPPSEPTSTNKPETSIWRSTPTAPPPAPPPPSQNAATSNPELPT